MAREVIRTERLRKGDDSGYSLIELVVAMSLFSAFLVMFVGAVVSVSRAATETRVDAQTSSAVGVAMQRVERSVRYADAINHPGIVGPRAYVEWRTDASSAASGVTTCTQLRYSEVDGTIAIRSWAAASAPSTGAWNVILQHVREDATATYPFTTVPAASGISNYQGVTIRTLTGGSERAGTEAQTTVYAKNSTVDSPSNATNAAGQSVTPVCTGMEYRP